MSDIMAASSAEAAASSSLSAEQAQSTDDYNYTEYETSGATTLTFGTTSPVSTGDAATATDSNGSTITGASATNSKDSTLSTSTISDTTAAAAASDHASESPHYPSSSAGIVEAAHGAGPHPGTIAAGVIIPIVVLSALAFGIFLLRRKRRRQVAPQNELQHPMTDRSSKRGTLLKETAVRPPPPNGPILTSTTNNAYYTGISLPSSPTSTIRGPSGDSARTSERASSYNYEPPPPAYARTARPGESTYTLPHLNFNSEDPFMDPVSVSPSNSNTNSSRSNPTHAALAALEGRDTAFTANSLSPVHGVQRPELSRANTLRSITSDTYSDTASLHSARPARRSGGVTVVRGSSGEYAPGNPFGDP